MNTLFSTPISKQVTLSSGTESVTLTVDRPPLLFATILDRALPVGEDGSAIYRHRLELHSVLWAAEGIRSSQQLPPLPAIDAGEEKWQTYAEDMAETFRKAGLLAKHIRELSSAALDLNIGNPAKSNLEEALAVAGND